MACTNSSAASGTSSAMAIDSPRLNGEGQLSILTVTTLFPNPVQTVHGIFVETRLQKLVATGEVVARVLAPVPWLPSFVNYPSVGPLHQVPRPDMRDGLPVEHPRYVVVPKLGMNVTPYTLYLSMRKCSEADPECRRAYRPDRCALFLPGWCRGGLACARIWLTRRRHGTRHGSQPDPAIYRSPPTDPARSQESRWR